MIKARVRNFQSIEDATIEIDGLTVVTGTNNAGKSAFFRAIRGAFTNARGHEFVRRGKPHCTVDLTFEDGRTLTWEKGKGVNNYVVNGKEFPNVGHGVPEEAQVFGVEPVSVGGKTELWPQIAPQITGVCFLLDQPGSVMAESVADVRRVNQLTRALKDSESDKRSARASLKVRRKDGKTLSEKLEGFSGLDGVLESVAAIEAKHEQATKLHKANANLVKLGARHAAAKEAVEALAGIEAVEEAVPDYDRVKRGRALSDGLGKAREIQERHENAKARVAALEGLDDVERAVPSQERVDYVRQFRKALGVSLGLALRCESAREDYEKANEAYEASEQVDMDDGVVEKIRKFKKALDKSRDLRTRVSAARDVLTGVDQQIEKLEQELASLNEKLSAVLGSYEECPTCGGSLDHVHE